MNRFACILTSWYEENTRDLPWRHTRDPYLIWISEIILQQTRVAQGYDYYMRFVRRFPDVFSLAEAEEDEVMRLWQGLGYYSRARNLHAAAKSVAEAAVFPTTYEGVLSLKGVGEYTAAAICSFSYDMPYAVVDGNVYRVLSRWLGIDTPIDSTKGKKLFAEAASELMDKHHPALYNQAVMEFGALQCTPASPDCTSCPLAESCAALQQGRVESLPVKAHKTKVTDRFFHYIYVRMGAYTFINKRTGNDIWKNLYQFPLIETAGTEEERNRVFMEKLQELFEGSQLADHKVLLCGEENATLRGEKCRFVKLLQTGVKHVLSHRVIHASLYEVEIPENIPVPDGWIKVKMEDLHKFAVPNLVSQFFSLILASDNQNK
jgi:A/G-specific adenine glycosylase